MDLVERPLLLVQPERQQMMLTVEHGLQGVIQPRVQQYVGYAEIAEERFPRRARLAGIEEGLLE